MQSIIHTENNFQYISNLFYDLEYLYTLTSEKTHKQIKLKLVERGVSKQLYPILQLFNNAGYHYDFNYVDKRYDKIDVSGISKNNMIVCFSGGKDSFATILHYMNKGYDVTLYHVTGLNKHYTKEIYSVDAIANELKLPFVIEDISYKGQHEWIEHPLKNIVMVNMALNYGLQHNLAYKIAVGDFFTTKLVDNVFEVCGGDCADFLRTWEKIVPIKNFHIYLPFRNYHNSYNMIMRYGKQNLLPHIQSCMTPNRFRELFKKRTESKYHIELLPERCGCCWKCAIEYIWMVDHDVFSLNKDYYKHCLSVLRNNLVKEQGILYNSVIDVWEHYFFYNIPRWLKNEETTFRNK